MSLTPLWTAANDYYIEKLRLPVVVTTIDGQRFRGDLFVQANARGALGHESAPDVMNDSDLYFPLAATSGDVLLFAKGRVRDVVLAREDVEEPDWSIGTAAEVEIQVVGGVRHVGVILIQLESARQRVLDYLNRLTSPFMTVYTDREVVLVNSEVVSYVQHRN